MMSFLNYFMIESSSKIVQKNPKSMKKTWNFSKLLFFGNFQISNKNSLEMSEIDKNFDIFDFSR